MNIFHDLGAGSLLALTLSALGLVGPSRVQAATFFIPNGDVAALKRALRVANTNGQDDIISLAVHGTYTLLQSDNILNGSNGLPVIQPDAGHRLVLLGNGATIARSRATGIPSFRLLFVNHNASLSVSGSPCATVTPLVPTPEAVWQTQAR